MMVDEMILRIGIMFFKEEPNPKWRWYTPWRKKLIREQISETELIKKVKEALGEKNESV